MRYDLVFEGGGAKGLVFVGAIQAFMARGHEVGRVIGASAGAITATLLAAGYTPDEIMLAINEKLPDGQPRFTGFLDEPKGFEESAVMDSFFYRMMEEVDIPRVPDFVEKFLDKLIVAGLMQSPLFRHFFSFFEHGGWYAGDAFVEWLEERLNAGGRGLGRASLAEFQAQTGRDLTLLASDTTAKAKLVLNHRTAPRCPVVRAVRMSMSYPFAWQEVRWQPDWGFYLGEDITGHAIIDGGMLSNFPMDLFTSTDAETVAVMGDRPPSENVLGFLIDETLEVPGAGEPEAAAAPPEEAPDARPGPRLSAAQLKELEVVARLKRMIDTVTQAHDKFVMEAHQDKVVRLPAKGYETLDFGLSDARRDALIAAGRAAAEAHFAAHDSR